MQINNMRKLIFTNLLLISIISNSQTNVITSLNNILSKCPNSYSTTDKSGNRSAYLQKAYLKLNSSKTELTYAWDVINSLNNKKTSTYSYVVKIKDIDFNNIKENKNENSTIVSITQINHKKTFVLNCAGEDCYEAIEYTDNFAFEFFPNCLEENLHIKFINLFKKLATK